MARDGLVSFPEKSSSSGVYYASRVLYHDSEYRSTATNAGKCGEVGGEWEHGDATVVVDSVNFIAQKLAATFLRRRTGQTKLHLEWLASAKNGTSYVQKSLKKKKKLTFPVEIRAGAGVHDMNDEDVVHGSEFVASLTPSEERTK